MVKWLIIVLSVVLIGFHDFDQLQDEKSELCKQSIECVKLAEVGYYEARGESKLGILSVLGVVINRTNDKRFPDTISKVVNQPKQFSYLTSQTYKRGIKEVDRYDLILELAYDMLNKNIENPTSAIYFQHKSIKKRKYRRNAMVINNHVFFN